MQNETICARWEVIFHVKWRYWIYRYNRVKVNKLLKGELRNWTPAWISRAGRKKAANFKRRRAKARTVSSKFQRCVGGATLRFFKDRGHGRAAIATLRHKSEKGLARRPPIERAESARASRYGGHGRRFANVKRECLYTKGCGDSTCGGEHGRGVVSCNSIRGLGDANVRET